MLFAHGGLAATWRTWGPSFQLPVPLQLLATVPSGKGEHCITSRWFAIPAGKKAAGAYALSIQGEPMQYVEDLMEDNGVHRGR